MNTECVKHEWTFEPGDWCPVCQGIEIERERHLQWLDRIRTMYEEKANIWYEGYEYAVNDIIKLLETKAEITGYVEIKLETLIALIKEGKE